MNLNMNLERERTRVRENTMESTKEGQKVEKATAVTTAAVSPAVKAAVKATGVIIRVGRRAKVVPGRGMKMTVGPGGGVTGEARDIQGTATGRAQVTQGIEAKMRAVTVAEVGAMKGRARVVPGIGVKTRARRGGGVTEGARDIQGTVTGKEVGVGAEVRAVEGRARVTQGIEVKMRAVTVTEVGAIQEKEARPRARARTRRVIHLILHGVLMMSSEVVEHLHLP